MRGGAACAAHSHPRPAYSLSAARRCCCFSLAFTTGISPASGRTKDEETLWLVKGVSVRARGTVNYGIWAQYIGAGEELIIAAPGNHHAIGRVGHAHNGSRARHDFAGGEDHGGVVSPRHPGRICGQKLGDFSRW